jgi:hypothetical protein
MTRAITNSVYDTDSIFWDFVYQAVVIGLGVLATGAIVLQITGL